MRLRFTKEQLSVLERVREVLSATGKVPSEEEAILKCFEDLLEKRDPVRKAARAKTRVQKRVASAEVSSDVPELPQAERAVPPNARSRVVSMMTAVPKGDVRSELTAVQQGDVVAEMTAVPKRDELAELTAVPKSEEKKKLRGRRGIPTLTIHRVWNRDEGCCSGILPGGSRCSSKIGLQVDHVRPVAFGQDNRLENLRLLCRQCNIAAAEVVFGTAIMERYRWLNVRASFG